MVSVRASSGTLKEKFPLTSVRTPMEGKSVHTTLAAMTGSLSADEITVPEMVICFFCAHVTPIVRKRRSRASVLYLMRVVVS